VVQLRIEKSKLFLAEPLGTYPKQDLESLDTYSWCGHAVLLGKRKLPGQVIDEMLIQYGQNLLSARRNNRKFVADGIPNSVPSRIRRRRVA
jgi:hypothetical protein